MLKLASVRDYPEVFAAHKLHAVLTDDEMAAYADVTGFYGQRDWLLRRMILKDLAAAYLGAHHKRYYPPNALEVRDAPVGYVVVALLASQEAPVLTARCVTDGDLGAGFVAADLGSARAGLKMRRIVRTYPFLTDAHLTCQEEDLLRDQSEADLDVTATLLVTAKGLCAKLLPEVTDPDAFHVLHIDGDDRVHFDLERLAMPSPLNAAMIRSWHWDDYVIVAGLLYDQGPAADGTGMGRLLEWV